MIVCLEDTHELNKLDSGEGRGEARDNASNFYFKKALYNEP